LLFCSLPGLYTFSLKNAAASKKEWGKNKDVHGPLCFVLALAVSRNINVATILFNN
jgi:hypothetical protein